MPAAAVIPAPIAYIKVFADVRWMFAGCSLDDRWMIAGCSLDDRWMFAG